MDLKGSTAGQSVRLCDYRVDANGALVGHNVVVGGSPTPVNCYYGATIEDSLTFSLSEGETTSVSLALTTPTTRASVGFAYSGSYIASALETPAGMVYYPTLPLPPGVSQSAGAGFQYYLVDNPAVGDWTLHLTGVSLPNGPETVSVTLSTEPNAVGGIAELPVLATERADSIDIATRNTWLPSLLVGAGITATVLLAGLAWCGRTRRVGR